MDSPIKIRNTSSGDLEQINSWLVVRGQKPTLPDEMPDIGFMAEVGDNPIAAVFLRKCEGNFAILDGLITDPTIPGNIRHGAIDLLVEAAIYIATDLKFKNIFSFTIDESVLTRSGKHGFVKCKNVVVISKDLAREQ